MNQQKIFISYSRADGQEPALELARRLREAGANIWLDQVDIEPGKIWDVEIENALQAAETLVFLVTDKSLASNNVLNEVYYALEENKEVIPVVFHKGKMPFRLARLQYIDFTADYNTAVSRLIKTLELTALASTSPLVAPEQVLPVTEKIQDSPSSSGNNYKPAPAPVNPVIEPQPRVPVYAAPVKKSGWKATTWIIAGVIFLLLVLAGLYGGDNTNVPPATVKDKIPYAENHTDDKAAVADQPANKPAAIPNWKTTSTETYSMQYPPDWELRTNWKGVALAVLARLENDHDDFQENVNLLIQDLTGRGIDLNNFTEISEGQVRDNGGTLIESKRINSGQFPYQLLRYSADQGVRHLNFEQYYWVLHEKAYVLTLTCEQHTFADYRETGEKILHSFYFKP